MSDVWKAPPTSSGIARLAPRVSASSHAACTDIDGSADDDLARRIDVAQLGAGLVADGARGVVVQAEDRRHLARRRLGGRLRELAAPLDEAKSVLEAERAGSGKRAVLAQAVARHEQRVGLHDASDRARR